MNAFLKPILLIIASYFIALQMLYAQTVSIPELNLTFKSNEVHLSDSAEAYVHSVVEIMKNKALHRNKLNFDNIYQAIRYYANGAQRIEDTHQAIKKVMPLLKDHHSYFMPSEYVSQSLGLTKKDIETIKSGNVPRIGPEKRKGLEQGLSYAQGKIIGKEIGYLSVPAFDKLYYEAMTAFADSLQRMIRLFDQQNVVGWIVDLRGNDGGADMPMIAGLGPLLDSENIYYCVDENGLEMGRTYYKDGGYYNIDSGEEDTAALVQSTVNYQLTRAGYPVAILTNFRTASSAEAVATIFAGQPNVKIIGQKTNGLTTVNSFNFLKDNSVLNLTIGYYANRHRKVYNQGITPDLLVEPGGTPEKSKSDEALATAIEWLGEYR